MAVLSPAKQMAPASLPGREPSRPLFEAEAVRLAEVLRACPAWQLESLLGINPELALRAFLDYQGFGRAEASPALLSYRGLAYQYLEAETFTAEDWDYAADHLRLLSALYGAAARGRYAAPTGWSCSAASGPAEKRCTLIGETRCGGRCTGGGRW